MNNTLVQKLYDLFEISLSQVQSSPGKKIFGLITIIKPHQRLLFGSFNNFSSAGVLKFDDTRLEVYVIKNTNATVALCYKGVSISCDPLDWTCHTITPHNEVMHLNDDEKIKLEQELEQYFVGNHIVASIAEDDPRAGYFIPVYN